MLTRNERSPEAVRAHRLRWPMMPTGPSRGLWVAALMLCAGLACGEDERGASSPAVPAVMLPAPEPPPPPPDPTVVMAVDFDTTTPGDYTRAAFDADFPTRRWVNGLGRGLVEIVEEPAAYSGRSVRIKFPAGTFGGDHAFQSNVEFPRMYEDLYVSYRLRFEEGFDFVRGGKLSGFYGGVANAGGNPPNGGDGWTGRMTWRPGGAAVQYLYHPDQPDIYGEDFRWGRDFRPGIWHTVEHRFVMNTPGMHDGVVQTWFDGEAALDVEGLRFRDVDTFAIDGFRIAFFFGGNDSSWATTKDEYIYWDDLIVSTEPIRQKRRRTG